LSKARLSFTKICQQLAAATYNTTVSCFAARVIPV
jgi:hypothetical protein